MAKVEVLLDLDELRKDFSEGVKNDKELETDPEVIGESIVEHLERAISKQAFRKVFESNREELAKKFSDQCDEHLREIASDRAAMAIETEGEASVDISDFVDDLLKDVGWLIDLNIKKGNK